MFVVELRDERHSASSLTFKIRLSQAGKVGVNNVRLYLLNGVSDKDDPFEVEMVPAYSVSTPANKGMQVRLNFP